MPSQSHITKYAEVFRDIQRELWTAAQSDLPPKALIYAELKRLFDKTRYYEKTGRISTQPPAKQTKAYAAYRICRWLVEQDAHYIAFVNGFLTCKNALVAHGIDPTQVSFSFVCESNKFWASEKLGENAFRRFEINFFYLTAEQRVFESIIETVEKAYAPGPKRIATNYVRSPEAQSLLAVYTDISPLRLADVYDLSVIFDSVNAQYFDCQIPKPLIAWTSRSNYRKVGSYNYVLNMILISRIMNDHRVPELAVRFVMYHEMLHIKHGIFEQNGRVMAHTPEFLADERQFIGFAEAEKILMNLENLVKN